MIRKVQRSIPIGRFLVWAVGVVIGVVVGLITSDVILGVGAGAAFIAVVIGGLRVWSGDGKPKPRHP